MYISPLYYSFAAFGFAAFQVLLVNLWLLKYEPPEVLASFNYCYLVVIVGSQIATWGIHYSVLHKISIDRNKARKYLLSAIVLSLFMSVAVSLSLSFLLYAFEPRPIVDDLSESILLIFLCLVIVPVNKILMAYLNAINKMYFFSSVYLVRAIGLLVGTILFSVVELDGSIFRSVIFAELVAMALLCIAYIKYEGRFSNRNIAKFERKDIIDHFEFGRFSVLGGVALESNVRVDGFYVSIFCSVEQFAKYSFLSIVFEGVQQFHAIIRNFVNPLVNVNTEISRNHLKGYMRYSFIFGILLFLGFIVLFKPIVSLLNIPLLDVFLPAILLLGSISISSAFLPFDQVSNQKGRPDMFFKMSVSVLLVNVFFNSLFVPWYGLIGAAFSTLLAYSAYAFLIYKSIKALGIFSKC